MNSNIIEIRGLEKRYGKTLVLKIDDFVFKKGLAYLLIGGNGAGKSTLIKIMVKLIKPTSGNVLVNTKKMAYVPERFIYPDNLRVFDFLNILCKVKNCLNYQDKINYLLNWWNVDGKKKLSALSKGMKQKILIIQSIIFEVDLYIFDEPLNGLDIDSQNDFLMILRRLKDLGKTIIVCTHYDKYYVPFFDYSVYLNGGIIHEVKKSN